MALHWTRVRNPTKRRIMGLKAQCNNLANDPVLTSSEQLLMVRARNTISILLDNWTYNNELSKTKYNLKYKNK